MPYKKMNEQSFSKLSQQVFAVKSLLSIKVKIIVYLKTH